MLKKLSLWVKYTEVINKIDIFKIFYKNCGHILTYFLINRAAIKDIINIKILTKYININIYKAAGKFKI